MRRREVVDGEEKADDRLGYRRGYRCTPSRPGARARSIAAGNDLQSTLRRKKVEIVAIRVSTKQAGVRAPHGEHVSIYQPVCQHCESQFRLSLTRYPPRLNDPISYNAVEKAEEYTSGDYATT